MLLHFVYSRTKSAKTLIENSCFTPSEENLRFGWKWHFLNTYSEKITDTAPWLCTIAQDTYFFVLKKRAVLHRAAFLTIEVMQPGTAVSPVSIVPLNNALVQLGPIQNTVREVNPPALSRSSKPLSASTSKTGWDRSRCNAWQTSRAARHPHFYPPHFILASVPIRHCERTLIWKMNCETLLSPEQLPGSTIRYIYLLQKLTLYISV